MIVTREQLARLRPGVIVAVRVWPVWHLGIVSDERDEAGPRVLSRSRRAGVAADEPWDVFAQTDRDLPVAIVGYPSQLPPAEVLRRARAELGSGWNPLRNCEHFAFAAHGIPVSRTVEQVAQLLPALLRGGSLWV